MIFQGRKSLGSEALQVIVLSGSAFLFELSHILGVITYHGLHVSAIELWAVALREAILESLILGVQIRRQVYALLAGEQLELIVCLAVIVHHALTEFLHVVTGSLFRGKLSEFYFCQSTFSRLLGEVLVGWAQLREALGACLRGTLVRALIGTLRCCS